MTFERFFQRGIRQFVRIRQDGIQFIDHSVIAASVRSRSLTAEVVDEFGNLPDGIFAEILFQNERVFAFAKVQFSFRSEEADISSAVFDERFHFERRRNAVFKLHDSRLIVYDVVIATEYAFAVTAFFNGDFKRFFRRRRGVRYQIERKLACWATYVFPLFDIDPFRTVDAGILVAAFATSVRASFGCVFLFKIAQISHRRDRFASAADKIL